MAVGNLTGQYLVRVLRSAFADAHAILPRTKHRGELRRHSLKLRFWPDRDGQLMDLDWCFIKAMPGKQVGELRIGDKIGDCDNIRVIFFIGPKRESDPMPMIWILAVMQKKRDDFTQANINTFLMRRQIVLSRFYSG